MNFFLTIALQNYDSKNYIMSDKDNEFIAIYLNNNKNIKQYILSNHMIKEEHRHIHILLQYDKVIKDKKASTYHKNQLRKLIKNYYKPYKIDKNNRIWLKITFIENYTFNSAYLHAKEDEKIIINKSDFDDNRLKLELLEYEKHIREKENKKYRTLNKRNSWTFIHNYIKDKNIKIEKYEDIHYLEKSLFYNGIYFSYPTNKLMNDIYLFYTKDKELEFNILSNKEYYTKEELKQRETLKWGDFPHL